MNMNKILENKAKNIIQSKGIEVTCPSCKTKYLAKEMKTTCPKCNKTFDVTFNIN